MILSKSKFARLAGVTLPAVDAAIARGHVVPTGPLQTDGIDVDLPQNRAYIDHPPHQRRRAWYERHLEEQRNQSLDEGKEPVNAAQQPAFFEWFVRRLIRGAFAEGDGTILFFTKYGAEPGFFKRIATAARKAKDGQHAAASVEKILAAVAEDAESELKKMEALFLRFSEEDDEDLRRELDQILYEDEDGRRFDEEDEPEEQQATPADPAKEV